MPFILGTNSIKDTGYDVANSLRFNDGSSDYLSRTPSGAGSTTKGTFSFWVERGVITSDMYLWTNFANSTNWSAIGINNVDQVYFYAESSGSAVANLKTNRVFRDPSAWYHIVVALDSTDGTADDRVKIYINGVQETSFVQRTNPSSSADLGISEAVPMEIGRYGGGSAYFDGYMAEVVMIDNTTLAASDFGEFDSDSPTIWKPKDVSGLTFGTNGFYLDFEDSSALGNDAAGSNNFTVNNLTAIDQTTDTCTNNFCTLMSNHPSASNFTLSEGNLVASKSGAATVGLFGSSIMLTKGKWYYESKITDLAAGERSRMGVAAYESVTGTSTLGASYSGFEFTGQTDGRFSLNVAGSQTEIDGFNTYAQDDIIMWGIDMDNSKLYIGKNGDWFNYSSANTGGDPTSGNGWVTNNTTILAAPLTVGYVGHGSGTSDSTEVKINFGNAPYSISSGNADGDGFGNFEFAVPSGYFALCTKNLAEYG